MKENRIRIRMKIYKYGQGCRIGSVPLGVLKRMDEKRRKHWMLGVDKDGRDYLEIVALG
jgi:hypothetical protein